MRPSSGSRWVCPQTSQSCSVSTTLWLALPLLFRKHSGSLGRMTLGAPFSSRSSMTPRTQALRTGVLKGASRTLFSPPSAPALTPANVVDHKDRRGFLGHVCWGCTQHPVCEGFPLPFTPKKCHWEARRELLPNSSLCRAQWCPPHRGPVCSGPALSLTSMPPGHDPHT